MTVIMDKVQLMANLQFFIIISALLPICSGFYLPLVLRQALSDLTNDVDASDSGNLTMIEAPSASAVEATFGKPFVRIRSLGQI